MRIPRCNVRLILCVCVLKCYEEIYNQNLMTAALVSMKSLKSSILPVLQSILFELSVSGG